MVILSVVINMEKNKLIKTRLYFGFSVLFLTAVVIVVYTSVRSSVNPDGRHSDQAQEQTKVAEDGNEDLQQASSMPHPEASGTKTPEESGDEMTVHTQPVDKSYRLGVENGYLQVYVAQTGKLFMETAIAYDLLPERVQTQIDEGKYFESEEALLEFLENYSS